MRETYLKIAFIGFIIIFLSTISYSQSQSPNIDPKWDKYYNDHPSGIEENHQASDFLNIANRLQFILKKGNMQQFQKFLLALTEDDLKQMMMDGWYYSRTFKHDDYFYLYNLTYKNITKESWDEYCPYLIPLMSLDKTISLH
jgi:hypothetical protein